MTEFIHLHTHSEYSLLDGAARVPDLVDRAKELGMGSLAITDHGAMYGAVQFYREAVKNDIKPIIGCEAYYTPGSRRERRGKPELYHLLLLAKDDQGYRNLMGLVSQAFLDGFYYRPQIDDELLERYHEGLVATSACMSGAVSKSIERGEHEKARDWAKKYRDIFGDDFYLELQDQGITTDAGVTQAQLAQEIAEIGHDLSIPLVATNDVHYIEHEDALAQDLLVCIGTGRMLSETGRMRFDSDQFFLKSGDEMAEAMSAYPEALATAVEIADKCNVDLDFGGIVLPEFDVPDDRDRGSYLEERCVAGLERRYGSPPPEKAVARLRHELTVIEEKGFADYFLVVEDFVTWAKEQGIGVGPGRGSAAGSIISYSLGITNLDPLEHGLLFERFLNAEREEMPDIDIDFDDRRRDEVIGYVREKYGEDKVAQIITFGTLKARQAIRDAGRVLGYPYGVPDRIAKQIPEQLNITKEDEENRVPLIRIAFRQNPELAAEYEAGGDSKRILDAALKVEGIVRGDGVHAAGVVICREPLCEYTPLKRTKGDEGEIVTQYDGDLIAKLGLLKMDFLGLRTLTVIADAVRAIEKNHGVTIDVDTIPMDDAKTWKLLQHADTDGVFQVESAGMKRVLRDLKPTAFADLVAVVALFRPGPMDSIDDFIARKHGKARVEYYDERLKPILEDTYGAIVYQEQAMRIAMEMAGFSAAKADRLRKGMGKKIQEIMEELKPQFIEGSIGRGYPAALTERVWRDVEEFGKYAFNKSHAAAYGLIAYQTAYLKANYPLEYMAAVLTSYMGSTDRLVKYLAACNKAGINVLSPDVNTSGRDFTVVGDSIRFGLSGIRNVGEGVVETVVDAREEREFESIHGFCDRVDMSKVNKRALESLVKAGALDSTGYTRKQMCDLLDNAVEMGLNKQRDREANQTSLFELEGAEEHGFVDEVPEPDGIEWPKRMKLSYEKEMLGIYVSDHPLREVEDVIREARTVSLGDQDEFRDGMQGWFAGIITAAEQVATRKGQLMLNFTLEDLEASIAAVAFPQVYAKAREQLTDDAIVRLRAKVESSDLGRKLLVQEVRLLAEDGRFAKPPGTLCIRLEEAVLGNGGGRRLKEILARYPGSDEVQARILADGGNEKVLRLPDEYRVDSRAPGLHAELKEMLGDGAVWEQ